MLHSPFTIDVIEKAVNTKDFYTWGSGGDIREIEIEDIINL